MKANMSYYIMYKTINKSFICIMITVLVCFMLLGSFQYSSKIESAAAIQINFFSNSVSFIKKYLIGPYLTCIMAGEPLKDFNTGKVTGKGSNKTLPLRKTNNDRVNNVLHRICCVLSTLKETNRFGFLLFLIITFIGLSVKFTKNRRINYRQIGIPDNARYYLNWILKFLNPREKYLKSRYNEYDIEHVVGFNGKRARTLNNIFGVRVFFVYKRSVL